MNLAFVTFRRRFALLLLLVLAPTLSAQPAGVTRVDRIVVTVADLAVTERFYRDALGFERVALAQHHDPQLAHLLGVEDAKLRVLVMRLGEQEVEFDQFDRHGHAYPADSRSPDRWFQHFAIIVSDMPRAYAQLRAHAQVKPISRGGPQTLPEQNGHVQAYKFRDPDGHPLELLYFPPGTGREVWQSKVGKPVFLGIDHSAIGIADTLKSLDFYTRLLGMQPAYAVTNSGPTQERLDGTFNAVVEITGLRPDSPEGPGVEFLDYRSPVTGRAAVVDVMANDLQHVHLSLAVDDLDALAQTLYAQRVPFVSPGVVDLDRREYGFSRALMIRDPDGHALLLTQ